MNDIFPVYEFRPLKEGNYKRYAGGQWIDDDGKYDLAFVELDRCMVYYVSVPYHKNIRWSWCTNGNWRAFVKNHPRGNAWHYMLVEGQAEWGGDWNRNCHPNEKAGREAMSFCSSRKSCANGRGAEFHINDPYIKAGLLREIKTKKKVKFPKIFNCMYCGELDWQKIEAKK